MAILKVLSVPHPFLHKVAEPVGNINDDIRNTLDDMLETMYAEEGIGLAAPQVHLGLRMLVIDLQREDSRPYKIINPEVTWTSEELSSYQEGCLSVPEEYADVERPAKAHIRYHDENGIEHLMKADGLLATCIQHEIDHLEGKLFIDYLS
ncbi:MAG: peptide deformylase, partial [Pseudomonadota bacterium]